LTVEELEEHLKAYAKDIIDIREGEMAVKLEARSLELWRRDRRREKREEKRKTKYNRSSCLRTKASYETKTILIATGSSRRKLKSLEAEQYDNKA